jgi:hypothetical protein
VIDLHLHTTASDGRCTPRELVERASAAGVTILAVTDHDTMASVVEVRTSARARGIEALPGIEITAVEDGRDVHMLGYFLDQDDRALVAFLEQQREIRVDRVRAIARRLADLGVAIDAEALVDGHDRGSGVSIGRPVVARALQAAGHVTSIGEAFDRFLGQDRPAFVPRAGLPPVEVIRLVHGAGGLVSLAHPGRTRIDARIAALAAAGLDALEVHHSDHDAPTGQRYHAMAVQLGLLETGGSDFHGDPARRLEPGAATLPFDAWERLRAAGARHAAR